MRVFLWGAHANEILPQFPYPTHDLVVRGVIPLEFEGNIVTYNEERNEQIQKKLLLEDAILDLPSVGNYERSDEIPYDKAPATEFQRYIRLRKEEMLGLSTRYQSLRQMHYDHRPLELKKMIMNILAGFPKEREQTLDIFQAFVSNQIRRLSGTPLSNVFIWIQVPDYAMAFVNGTSSKQFYTLSKVGY